MVVEAGQRVAERHPLELRRGLAELGALIVERAHELTLAQEQAIVGAAQLVQEPRVLDRQLAGVDQLGDERHQLGRSPRLAHDVVHAAAVDRGHHGVGVGVTGHQHAPHVGSQLRRARQQLDAVHARHAEVDDDHRELGPRLERGQRRRGERLGDHVEPTPERAIEQVEVVGLVVDAQDQRSRRAGRGRTCGAAGTRGVGTGGVSVGRPLRRQARIVGYCQCRRRL